MRRLWRFLNWELDAMGIPGEEFLPGKGGSESGNQVAAGLNPMWQKSWAVPEGSAAGSCCPQLTPQTTDRCCTMVPTVRARALWGHRGKARLPEDTAKSVGLAVLSWVIQTEGQTCRLAQGNQKQRRDLVSPKHTIVWQWSLTSKSNQMLSFRVTKYLTFS